MTRQTRSLEEAIAVVQSGSMSLREAARKFHVPRTTLQRRVQLRASAALRSAGLERVTAAPIAIGTDAESDTTGDNTLAVPRTIRQDVPVVGQKRSANDIETHNQGGRSIDGYIFNDLIYMGCV